MEMIWVLLVLSTSTYKTPAVIVIERFASAEACQEAAEFFDKSFIGKSHLHAKCIQDQSLAKLKQQIK